jgi:hypothetical protein
MMNSFCAGSNLKWLIKSGRCPNIIQKCQPILEKVYGDDQRGTLMTDLRTLDRNINGACEDESARWFNDKQKVEDLEPAVYDALKVFCQRDTTDLTVQRKAFLHAHYTFRGFRYTTSVSDRKESIVFFHPAQGGSPTPAAIRQIFSLPTHDGSTTLIVLMAVGASLWRAPTGSIQIINPSSAQICHANQRKWADDICRSLRSHDGFDRPVSSVERLRGKSVACAYWQYTNHKSFVSPNLPCQSTEVG